jgi:hypothetical protein
MSMLVRALGGLLAGAGEGIVDAAKQKREDALLALKDAQDTRDKTDERAFITQRDAKAHAYDMENTAAGSALRLKEIGITEGGANARSAAALAAENLRADEDRKARIAALQSDQDKALLDRIEGAYSEKATTIDADGNKTVTARVNAPAVASRLNELGRPDLARIYVDPVKAANAAALPSAVRSRAEPTDTAPPNIRTKPAAAPGALLTPANLDDMVRKAGGIDAAIASAPDDATMQALADRQTALLRQKNPAQTPTVNPAPSSHKPGDTTVRGGKTYVWTVRGSQSGWAEH